MAIILEEVKDEADFYEILWVLYEGFGEPFCSLRRWFMPIHTTVEAAIQDAKERTIKQWKQGDNIYWVKVVDTESRKIIGAARWGIYEKLPEKPNGPINAYWHIDGSEEKAFVEKLITSFQKEMAERMDRPHIELQQLFVHPRHRGSGAGKLLMDWGHQKADILGLECVVRSTPSAVTFYERSGYGMIEELVPDVAIQNPSKKWEEYASDSSVFLMWRPAGHDYQVGVDKAPWLRG